MAEPVFSNVALLALFDGANNATTDVDLSTHAHTLTFQGNAKLSTAQTLFGKSMLLLDGNGDDVLTDGATLDLPGDFCIEFFSYKSAAGVNGYDIVAAAYNSGGDSSTGWWLELSATRGFFFGFNATEVLSYATNPNDSTLRHWAIYRSGTTIRMARAGTIVATATGVSTSFPANRLMIGNDSYLEGYNGYLGCLRITRGEAVYGSSNFTPPSAQFSYPSRGQATGAGAAAAVGASTANGNGAATGAGTSAGAGKATKVSAGAASGAATAAAIATGIITAVGSASGAGSAAANANGPATGTASGAGTAAAVGASTASSIGQAFGAAAVTASGTLAACYPVSMTPVLMGKPTGPSSSTKTRKVRGMSPVQFGYPVAFHNATP